ncbi:MAG: sugar ABC transporter ATP-binding protein [Spirochaetia bacterium]|nr:sugar ABC transporter ATP-binding protein [Spirochaetia bacterium]
MNEYAIEAKGIEIGFNGIKILHDVDFSVRKGEVHALVGPNGAGKSTLVKILNGVYHKDAGTISLYGKPYEYASPEEALQAGIAMVFQDLSLIPTMTVAQNIFLKSIPFRFGPFIDDKASAKHALELLERIGVNAEIHPDDLVSDLSIGQQQLVEISKALSNDPKILILDEPTASLSTSEIERLFSVINTLKQKGITIIYITHYLQDIFKICDGVTMIRDGRVLFSKSTKEITLDQLVAAMTNDQGGKISWEHVQGLRETKPLLEAKNITTHSISNVSLAVYPGEIVGIAGLLGSGRTELLRALFGIDPIVKGEILLDGKPIILHSTSDAIEHGIALVPENRREQGLVLDYSVSENLIMPIVHRIKRLLFVDERKKDTIVKQYIKQLGVKTQGPGQVVRYLSGGNQQKIVVAKFLASDSRVLLLDDPTFGVDLQAKHEIMKIIHAYAAKGNAVVMVSSEFNELADYCDSIYVMKRGKLSECLSGSMTEDNLLYMVQ